MTHYIQLFFLITLQMYIILNPPSVIAVMLGLSADASMEERLNLSKKVCTVGGGLLLVFAVLGTFILDDVFQISTEAFRVGGGLFLFYVGLSMISSKEHGSGEDSAGDKSETTNIFSFAVTPLATPLLVGPGTITATLVKRSELTGIGDISVFYLAVAFTLVLVYVSFVVGCKFSKYLTPAILKIVEKLVGLLLMCIAVKSILSGLQTFVSQL